MRYAHPVISVAPKRSLSSIPRPNSKVEQGLVKVITREGKFWLTRA